MGNDAAFNARIYARYASLPGSAHRPLPERERGRLARAYLWYVAPLVRDHERGAWLDLGCGQGLLLSVARALGFDRVRGVDSSPEMVDVAQRLGLPAEHGDALAHLKQVPSHSLAVVSAFDLLEHLDREACLEILREVRRVLAPHGLLLAKLPNGASPWSNAVFHSDLTHRVLYTPASLTLMMSLAGFGTCECREMGPALVSWKGWVRGGLWRVLRVAYQACDVIETGSAGFDVKTRVMLARVRPEPEPQAAGGGNRMGVQPRT